VCAQVRVCVCVCVCVEESERDRERERKKICVTRVCVHVHACVHACFVLSIGPLPQKRPVIAGSFAENDLRL